MSKATDKNSDRELDDLLNLAAREMPQADGALLERVLADAYRIQDDFSTDAGPVTTGRKGIGGIATIFAVLGGWRSVSGLATAVGAGVWLGYAPPAMIDDFAAGIWSGAGGYELGDFLVSAESFLVEG